MFNRRPDPNSNLSKLGSGLVKVMNASVDTSVEIAEATKPVKVATATLDAEIDQVLAFKDFCASWDSLSLEQQKAYQKRFAK